MWLRTTKVTREKTLLATLSEYHCTSKGSFIYMHHLIDRIARITAFVNTSCGALV